MVDTTTYLDESNAKAALRAMDLDRALRINEHTHIEGLSQSLAGTVALETMLSEAGLPRPYVYSYSENGKPSVEGAAEFSISHTKGMAVAVLRGRDNKRIGVDIEQIRTYNTGIPGRFFVPHEVGLIQSDEDFYRMWTFKEAVAKCFDFSFADIMNKIAYGKTAYMDCKWRYRHQREGDYIITVVEEV